MKKKILITLTYYSPYLSGLTLAAKNLAKLLKSRGYDVTILTTQHDKKLPLSEVKDDLEVKRIPYLLTLNKGFIYKCFLWYVFSNVRKNDQVIINLPQFEGFIIALVAKIMKKRIICIYHCTVTLDNTIFSRLITSLLRLANELSLILADTIVVTSNDFAENDSLVRNYRSKVTAIYPVIDELTYTERAQNNFKSKIPLNKKYKIGFIGRLSKEKGIEYLLQSIPILKGELGDSFIILIVGSATAVGEESYAKSILKLAETYKDNVLYLGSINDEELASFYTSLDVLVVPSTNATEAFGMVQIEAMRFGVPIVATNLPGVRVPITKTGMGEVVSLKNSSSIAHAIVTILRHPALYKKNNKILNEFSTEKIFAEFDRLLKAS